MVDDKVSADRVRDVIPRDDGGRHVQVVRELDLMPHTPAVLVIQFQTVGPVSRRVPATVFGGPGTIHADGNGIDRDNGRISEQDDS